MMSDPGSTVPAMSTTTTESLSDRDLEILRFEAGWWKYPGAKDQAIRDLFPDVTVTRYYQRLNALIDRPEALAAEPLIVKRLRRIRAHRKARRPTR